MSSGRPLTFAPTPRHRARPAAPAPTGDPDEPPKESVSDYQLLRAVDQALVRPAQRPPAAAMADAASRFLAALTPQQRQGATFPFDAAERQRWNFIPTEAFPRNGLLLKDMTAEQRTLAHALLRTGLSQRGYSTYTAIIQLEDVLRLIDSERFVRDPLLYRIRHAHHHRNRIDFR